MALQCKHHKVCKYINIALYTFYYRPFYSIQYSVSLSLSLSLNMRNASTNSPDLICYVVCHDHICNFNKMKKKKTVKYFLYKHV